MWDCTVVCLFGFFFFFALRPLTLCVYLLGAFGNLTSRADLLFLFFWCAASFRSQGACLSTSVFGNLPSRDDLVCSFLLTCGLFQGVCLSTRAV